VVEKQLKKVDNLDRENLLQYNTKKQNNRVPLEITYSKALPNIHEILKKNMKILYNSEQMKRIFDEPPMVSYKRDKNIKFLSSEHSCPHTQSIFVLLSFLDRMELRSLPSLDDLTLHASTLFVCVL
jgi:hypothetical protein